VRRPAHAGKPGGQGRGGSAVIAGFYPIGYV
jgi:hypothetical protein